MDGFTFTINVKNGFFGGVNFLGVVSHHTGEKTKCICRWPIFLKFELIDSL